MGNLESLVTIHGVPISGALVPHRTGKRAGDALLNVVILAVESTNALGPSSFGREPLTGSSSANGKVWSGAFLLVTHV